MFQLNHQPSRHPNCWHDWGMISEISKDRIPGMDPAKLVKLGNWHLTGSICRGQDIHLFPLRAKCVITPYYVHKNMCRTYDITPWNYHMFCSRGSRMCTHQTRLDSAKFVLFVVCVVVVLCCVVVFSFVFLCVCVVSLFVWWKLLDFWWVVFFAGSHAAW